MKELILIIGIVMLFLLMMAINDLSKKLDKLIELNTPEYINVIPDYELK